MLTMAKKKNNPWPTRLKALRDRLGLTNDQMAQRLRIDVRLWKSWVYGERQPRGAAVALITLMEEGKIRG
jgi:DNA-binding transcriptional regulator YiaG